MEKNKCLDCKERASCKDSFSSWVFFIIGIVATVAIRFVTVLIHMDPLYAKIAWYIGVTGFLVFFIYKFKVNKARSRLINERNLTSKISKRDKLTKEDYDLIEIILCGLNSKKENINYLFIFALSAVALILAVYMDFLK